MPVSEPITHSVPIHRCTDIWRQDVAGGFFAHTFEPSGRRCRSAYATITGIPSRHFYVTINPPLWLTEKRRFYPVRRRRCAFSCGIGAMGARSNMRGSDLISTAHFGTVTRTGARHKRGILSFPDATRFGEIRCLFGDIALDSSTCHVSFIIWQRGSGG